MDAERNDRHLLLGHTLIHLANQLSAWHDTSGEFVSEQASANFSRPGYFASLKATFVLDLRQRAFNLARLLPRDDLILAADIVLEQTWQELRLCTRTAVMRERALMDSKCEEDFFGALAEWESHGCTEGMQLILHLAGRKHSEKLREIGSRLVAQSLPHLGSTNDLPAQKHLFENGAGRAKRTNEQTTQLVNAAIALKMQNPYWSEKQCAETAGLPVSTLNGRPDWHEWRRKIEAATTGTMKHKVKTEFDRRVNESVAIDPDSE